MRIDYSLERLGVKPVHVGAEAIISKTPGSGRYVFQGCSLLVESDVGSPSPRWKR